MRGAHLRPRRARGSVRFVAVALYFVLSALAVWGDRALYDRAHPTPSAWLTAKVALPIALTLVALLAARRAGLGRERLGLGRGRTAGYAIALLAGIAPVAVVIGHGVSQGFAPLLGRESALLVLRIALNQAWFEELAARGLLLGLLLERGSAARRAVWVSSGCFALMHVLQFLWPPLSVEGLLNGLVLVLLTLPVGYALARLTLAAGSIWPAVLLHLLLDLTILPQKLQHASALAIILASVVSVAIVLVAPTVRLAGKS